MNAFSFPCQINMWERWETLKTPPKNVPSAKEHEIDIIKKCLFCLCHCADVPTGLGDAPSGQSAKQTWERCNLISSNHQRQQKVDKGQDKSRHKATKLQWWEAKQVIRDKIDVLIEGGGNEETSMQFNLQIKFLKN